MFYELGLPALYVTPTGISKWFVLTKDPVLTFGHGYLDTDGIIRSVDGMDYTRCYYDTELKAHNAAAGYYHTHFMVYPHYDKHLELLDADEDGETTIQSEEMKF